MTEPEVYYVYFHVEPETQEVVYIGKGSYGRAWDVTRSRNDHLEHRTWMKNLAAKGYLPTDWVLIVEKHLTNRQACKLEIEHFHKIGTTRFNRKTGEYQYQSKLTNKTAREIYILTKTSKEYHKDIAKRYGVARSVVSMISNRTNWKTATTGVIIDRQEES